MKNQSLHTIHLFLSGDVMTGRGIDQILANPSDPLIHEPFMKSARGYVDLAEKVNGPIQQPVNCAYIWGDALEILERAATDLRIINLETSVTESADYWTDKTIHYKMHPKNIDCIAEAGIDYCSLANNHILDWGYSGLAETLKTLTNVKIKSSGAGRNLQEAETPAIITVKGKGRVIVFSYGSVTSGIPQSWAASENRPGVNLLKDLSEKTARHIEEKIRAVKQKGDIIIASVHWGSNWGYDISPGHRDFAHKLVDNAGVDILHGHSSHHVKGIEVYRDKLIIYGCGDLLNDYEGIPGYEGFRDDLGLMYFVSVRPLTGELVRVQMTPTQIRNFKINRASRTDALWLRNMLNREGKKFGTRVELDKDNTLTLHWD